MTISFELTAHDQRKMYEYILKRTPTGQKGVWVGLVVCQLGLLAISAILALCVSFWIGIYFFGGGIGYVLFMGGPSWMRRRLMDAYFKRHPELVKTLPFAVCLDEDGVSVDGPKERRLWRWVGIHDCRRDFEMISFWSGWNCQLLIPLSVFIDQEKAESFFQFAVSKVNKAGFR